jgi:prevent-host-death family protein
MVTVGVRELKQQTSELIRRVRELGDEILVTHHGRVVARIVPASPTPEAAQRGWDDLDRLAAEIGKRWPEGVSAAQAVSEARR